jgi:hypothetical protein
MKNAEIRARALSKMKNKIAGLSAIVVIVYIVQKALGMLAQNLLLSVAVNMATVFLSAGLARVAMRAWREGKALWSDLAVCFRERRYLLIGLYGCVLAAVFGVLKFVVYSFAGNLAGSAAAIVLDWAAALCTGYMVFAADILENHSPLKAALAGLGTLMKNIGRVILMEISLYWWIVLAMAIMFLFFGVVGGVSGTTLMIILFVAMAVLKWVIFGYIVLCEAGLARTLLKK